MGHKQSFHYIRNMPTIPQGEMEMNTFVPFLRSVRKIFKRWIFLFFCILFSSSSGTKFQKNWLLSADPRQSEFELSFERSLSKQQSYWVTRSDRSDIDTLYLVIHLAVFKPFWWLSTLNVTALAHYLWSPGGAVLASLVLGGLGQFGLCWGFGGCSKAAHQQVSQCC